MNDVIIWCFIALLAIVALAPVVIEFLSNRGGDDD